MFQLSSSDDDFVDPQEGSSNRSQDKNKVKKLSAEELNRQKQRERAAKSRAKKSDEQKQQDRNKAAKGMAANRASKTPEQKELDRKEARERMARLRLPTLTKVCMKDGLRTQEIFSGTFIVAELSATPACDLLLPLTPYRE